MTNTAASLQPVCITSLSSEDLAEGGFDTSRITQEQLDDLAKKMTDNYVDLIFWNDMVSIADMMDLPRI